VAKLADWQACWLGGAGLLRLREPPGWVLGELQGAGP